MYKLTPFTIYTSNDSMVLIVQYNKQLNSEATQFSALHGRIFCCGCFLAAHENILQRLLVLAVSIF